MAAAAAGIAAETAELSRLSQLIVTPEIAPQYAGCTFRQAFSNQPLRTKAVRWRGGDERRREFTRFCKLMAAVELEAEGAPPAPAGTVTIPLPLRRAAPIIQRAANWRSQLLAVWKFVLPSWQIGAALALALLFPRIVALTLSLIFRILVRAVVLFLAECLNQASIGAFKSLEGLITGLWSIEFLTIHSMDSYVGTFTAGWPWELYTFGANSTPPALPADPVYDLSTPGSEHPHPLLPFLLGTQLMGLFWAVMTAIRTRAAAAV